MPYNELNSQDSKEDSRQRRLVFHDFDYVNSTTKKPQGGLGDFEQSESYQ